MSKDEAMGYVSVRLTEEILARLDALAIHMSTESRTATRSEVLREVLLTGIEAHEALYEKPWSPEV